LFAGALLQDVISWLFPMSPRNPDPLTAGHAAAVVAAMPPNRPAPDLKSIREICGQFHRNPFKLSPARQTIDFRFSAFTP